MSLNDTKIYKSHSIFRGCKAIIDEAVGMMGFDRASETALLIAADMER
jgi:hypothetical protein